MTSSQVKLPDKGIALFDVRANDDEAYEFVQELRLFLQTYRNSGPHHVKDASTVNITVSTVHPDFVFKLCLYQTELQRQYTHASNSKISEDFDNYRISDFRAKDGKKLVPLKTWLTPRIRALTNVLQSSALEVISDHVRLNQSSDFYFWRATKDMTISVTARTKHETVLIIEHVSRTESLKMHLRESSSSTKTKILLAITNLQVKFRGEWISLVSWFDQYVHTHQNASLAGEVWQKGWSPYGVSRFLQLPVEIRIMIYQNVIGPYIWHCRPWSSRPRELTVFDLRSKNHRLSSRPRDSIVFDPHSRFYRLRGIKICNDTNGQYWFNPVGARIPCVTALPLVNRQINAEFSDVLWASTCKHFNRVSDFENVVTVLRKNPGMRSINANSLRRISLGFTNSGYFHFVGVTVDTWDNMLKPSDEQLTGLPIRIIPKMKTLETLNLHFQVSPPHAIYPADWTQPQPHVLPFGNEHEDPWHVYDHWAGLKPGIACQRTIVDWILTFALKHIRHVPKITLSGHIKDSTRREWESIFEEERRGIRHDMTAKIADILSTPGQLLPPACECRHLCSWWLEYGPWPEALGYRNNRSEGSCPFNCGVPEPNESAYDPKLHDLFVCED